MPRELKELEANYQNLTKEAIWSLIKKIKEKLDLKKRIRKTRKFASLLLTILEYYSRKGEIATEIIILNQLIELTWWGGKDKDILEKLSEAILIIHIDSHNLQKEQRGRLFNQFINMIIRFPNQEQIQDAITKAVINLIRVGTDEEILEIKETIREKASMYPMIESILGLMAKVYMNALFYLANQSCSSILKYYNEFCGLGLSEYKNYNGGVCSTINPFHGDKLLEILQEGAINAIINLARTNAQRERISEQNCYQAIRIIIDDAKDTFKKRGEDFFQDIYRLSYAFDQFDLWKEFLDIPIIQELKFERDKNKVLEEAKSKLLAIQKSMRIEEYDSRKILRRGIKFAYNLDKPEELKKLLQNLVLYQKNQKKEALNLVEDIDAIIDQNEKITNYLRETGQIPADRATIDEIQDQVNISDDLSVPALPESKILEQVNYLREIGKKREGYLVNKLLLAKGLIFGVGMYGFRSPKLDIKLKEITSLLEFLAEKNMIHEIIDPLIRAITLRAARQDGEAVKILLDLLNKYRQKFIKTIYTNYPFVENLTKLFRYLSKQGKIEKLKNIKDELEKANRLYLFDETIPNKIAQGLNEAILSYRGKDVDQKLELVNILEEISKVHSFNEELQLRYIEGMNYAIFDIGLSDWSSAQKLSDKLIAFRESYLNNPKIEAKAAIGVLLSMVQAKLNNQREKANNYLKVLESITQKNPNDEFIQQVNFIGKELLKQIEE